MLTTAAIVKADKHTVNPSLDLGSLDFFVYFLIIKLLLAQVKHVETSEGWQTRPDKLELLSYI